MHTKTPKRVKIICFEFWWFLCTQNLFVKKKKKKGWLEIVMVTSIYYTTDTYPYQHAYRKSICDHL